MLNNAAMKSLGNRTCQFLQYTGAEWAQMLLYIPIILPGLFDEDHVVFEEELMVLFLQLADRQVLLTRKFLSATQVLFISFGLACRFI